MELTKHFLMIQLSIGLALALVNPAHASMYGSGWIECKPNYEKIPATLDGKSICVLKVECLYGPLPEAMRDARKWKQVKVSCGDSNCKSPLKCARETEFAPGDLLTAKKKTQQVRKIKDPKGNFLFADWLPLGFEMVSPKYFDEAPVSNGNAGGDQNVRVNK